MMTLIALLVLAGGVGTALLALAFRPQRSPSPALAALYCPVHETLVEVKGDRCFACDDGRFIGSIWRCQRECLIEREAINS